MFIDDLNLMPSYLMYVVSDRIPRLPEAKRVPGNVYEYVSDSHLTSSYRKKFYHIEDLDVIFVDQGDQGDHQSKLIRLDRSGASPEWH